MTGGGRTHPQGVAARRDTRFDVSAIARAQGGGGHKPAAGFTTELPWEELVAFLRAAVHAQLQEM